MKVLYTIGTKFGGIGVGRVAAKSVGQTAVEHELHIAAAGFVGSLPARATAVRIKLPWRWPLARKKRYRFKKAIAFDVAAAKLIQPGLDVFHSWNSYCLHGLNVAKDAGATTIVTRASSHILTQVQIVREEFEKYAILREVEITQMIDRCVAEYEAADYVEVPSEFVRKSFLDRGFPEKKLLYAPFGVDSTIYRQAGHSGEVFRLLFVGRLGFRKGVHYLLEAWKKLSLPRAELVLVGNVEPGFEKILKEYRPLPGLVVRGFVKDLLELYASSSVFVFPSLEEGSALVIYEAMAAGLPVVTTFNSGSLVRDGVDGFIVPIRDPQAICENVARLYEDRDLTREMGRKGREYIKKYTWENYGREMAGHYRRIQETRSGAPA